MQTFILQQIYVEMKKEAMLANEHALHQSMTMTPEHRNLHTTPCPRGRMDYACQWIADTYLRNIPTAPANPMDPACKAGGPPG